MEYSAGGSIPGERYYRAVYVLQKLEKNACTEEEDIPARIIHTDDTESLLHHPDRILVLQYLAEELAREKKERPKARFYEACSRLALGERENAVKLLSAHVIENEYKSAHYALLCEALYELEDYKSLLLICREWKERDPECGKDRLRYTWAAHYNLGRYADARQVMRGEGACLGWQASVFDAKAALADGGEVAAKQALDQGIARHPERNMQIMRMWNILKPLKRV